MPPEKVLKGGTSRFVGAPDGEVSAHAPGQPPGRVGHGRASEGYLVSGEAIAARRVQSVRFAPAVCHVRLLPRMMLYGILTRCSTATRRGISDDQAQRSARRRRPVSPGSGHRGGVRGGLSPLGSLTSCRTRRPRRDCGPATWPCTAPHRQPGARRSPPRSRSSSRRLPG